MNKLKRLGSPPMFYRVSNQLSPWLLGLSVAVMIYGSWMGLFQTPPDYQQGDAYRIMYIHVPFALYSLMIYLVLSVSALIYLVWRIKTADALALASARTGAWITLLALVTGAIWGKPMWGTYWIWDARLTSELVLLFLYAAIILLRRTIPENNAAAKASHIFTLIGMLDLPIIHFSVYWWHTLHQRASISLTSIHIHPSMQGPLFIMFAGLGLFVIGVLIQDACAVLLWRGQNTRWVKRALRD